jgi:hypothetical protein
MDMRDHLPLLRSHLVETTSLQEELTQLSWFGKVTLKKMIKNLLKILVPNKVTTSKLEVFHQSHKKDHQLPNDLLLLLINRLEGRMLLHPKDLVGLLLLI